MSDESAVSGVLLAHGAMAMGMVDAVQRISGVGEEALVALSNEGKSPEALQEALDAVIGRGPAVIFTDLASGSCAFAARVCCRDVGNQVVICGANLPMLLDFVFNRHLPLPELVPRLLRKGAEGLMSMPEF
jgi:mannose/fructose-specific phosphotransferase system component IIA